MSYTDKENKQYSSIIYNAMNGHLVKSIHLLIFEYIRQKLNDPLIKLLSLSNKWDNWCLDDQGKYIYQAQTSYNKKSRFNIVRYNPYTGRMKQLNWITIDHAFSFKPHEISLRFIEGKLWLMVGNVLYVVDFNCKNITTFILPMNLIFSENKMSPDKKYMLLFDSAKYTTADACLQLLKINSSPFENIHIPTTWTDESTLDSRGSMIEWVSNDVFSVNHFRRYSKINKIAKITYFKIIQGRVEELPCFSPENNHVTACDLEIKYPIFEKFSKSEEKTLIQITNEDYFYIIDIGNRELSNIKRIAQIYNLYDNDVMIRTDGIFSADDYRYFQLTWKSKIEMSYNAQVVKHEKMSRTNDSKCLLM